jgi:NAD(P)-dependent dehydrogenase (short-subunit alcohol dehydrogenase family)
MKRRTVVVTGANRGLGLELSRHLAQAGWAVVGTAREPRSAIDLRSLEVRVEQLDVTDDASVRGFADRLELQAVDLLINNAGIGEAGPGIADLKSPRVLEVLDVNGVGPIRVARALLSNLRRGRERKIVQISSHLGSLAGNVEGGYYAYRASKAALNMLNRSLSIELAGQGFICVVLHPGWVRTRMGGARAPVSAAQSARGLLQVIAGLKRRDTGRFFDYTGAEVPW